MKSAHFEKVSDLLNDARQSAEELRAEAAHIVKVADLLGDYVRHGSGLVNTWDFPADRRWAAASVAVAMTDFRETADVLDALQTDEQSGKTLSRACDAENSAYDILEMELANR